MGMARVSAPGYKRWQSSRVPVWSKRAEKFVSLLSSDPMWDARKLRKHVPPTGGIALPIS